MTEEEKNQSKKAVETSIIFEQENIFGCPPDKNIRIGDFTQSKLEVN